MIIFIDIGTYIGFHLLVAAEAAQLEHTILKDEIKRNASIQIQITNNGRKLVHDGGAEGQDLGVAAFQTGYHVGPPRRCGDIHFVLAATTLYDDLESSAGQGRSIILEGQVPQFYFGASPLIFFRFSVIDGRLDKVFFLLGFRFFDLLRWT